MGNSDWRGRWPHPQGCSGYWGLGCFWHLSLTHSSHVSAFIVIHMSPFTAFLLEQLWWEVKASQSIHGSTFPALLTSWGLSEAWEVCAASTVWAALCPILALGFGDYGAQAGSAPGEGDKQSHSLALRTNVQGCLPEVGQQVWQTAHQSLWNCFFLEA